MAGVNQIRHTIKPTKDMAIKLAMFIVCPVLSFFYSLRNAWSKSSYAIFFLFALLFGIAFTIPQDVYFDSVSYVKQFEDIVRNNDISHIIDNYGKEDSVKDIYTYVVCYIVSLFSSNYHVLFFVYAAVFAFFMLKSLKFLTDQKVFSNNLLCFLLMVMFIMQNSIFNINGVRWCTAGWIACYALLEIILNNNKRYIILLCATPLVHLSFGIVIIVFAAYLLLKKRFTLLYVLLILSFGYSSIGSLLLATIKDSFAPQFVSKYFGSYLIEGGYENMYFKRGYNITEMLYMRDWPIVFANICLFFFISKRKSMNKENQKFFAFILVFMILTNLIVRVGDAGYRQLRIIYPLIAILWLKVFEGKKYNNIIYVLMPIALSYRIYQSVIHYSTVTSVGDYIFTPIYTVIKQLYIN
ncbi:MAG: EpsG family protein [Bacteroidales bacterium]|jgi:hypothetical protein|nr:EpsG family protein [Bacteroidales bacterium]